jgi:hypothetical protein
MRTPLSLRRLRPRDVLLITCAALGIFLFAAREAPAYPSPAIWVGSPINGRWGGQSPASHHRLVKAQPQNDWAVDLPSTGTVQLYVAASNPAYNARVTTKVTQIVDNAACRSGGGGDFVTVGIYYNGTLYGHATYAHLDRNPVLYVGRPVSRWGALLGSVARLSGSATGGSNCWTGPHVHFELRAQTQYACWNRGLWAGHPLAKTNFVGFVSGPLASYSRPCP